MTYRLTTADKETGEKIVEYISDAKKCAFALGCMVSDLPTRSNNGKTFKTFLGKTFVDWIETD